MKKETLIKKARQKYWFYTHWMFEIHWNDKNEERLLPQLKKLAAFYESQIYENGGKLFG